MRLIRYAALFGSLMLLVGTSVLLINSRAQERSDQIAQVESAADVVSVALRSNIGAARQAVELAGVAASAPVVDRVDLAEQVASMFEGAQACVGSSAGQCTGADLFALPEVGILSADADDGAVVGVEAASRSVLLVDRSASDGNVVTVIAQIPIDSLIDGETDALLESDGVEYTLDPSPTTTGNSRDRAVVDDGRRVVEATLGTPFVDGSIDVQSSVAADIALAGGHPLLYTVLLVLGAVLLFLAIWTFFLDRRSLQKQATTDELTGLINRREFERLAEETLDVSDRFNTGLCVMVVDLNGFKQVNDTMGHQFGDLVLKASAERLIEAVRDTDIVARWGGDEFVIMLPGLQDRTAVRNSAERISETLGGTPVVGDTTMTASIGAAIFPRHGDTLDALMRTADVAMYGAKTTGVGYRIADTISAQDDLFGDGSGAGRDDDLFGRRIDTAGYVGPDRRQTNEPLPPPTIEPPREREPESTSH